MILKIKKTMRQTINKFIDKTGQRFGNLLVLQFMGYDPKYRCAIFNCKCDCGNEKIVPTGHLNQEKPHTISCGCVRFMNRLMYIGLSKDISGMKYGRLTVLRKLFDKYESKKGFDKNIKKKRGHFYECVCDCGKIIIASSEDISRKKGGTKSCGCLLTESSKRTIKIANETSPNHIKHISRSYEE